MGRGDRQLLWGRRGAVRCRQCLVRVVRGMARDGRRFLGDDSLLVGLSRQPHAYPATVTDTGAKSTTASAVRLRRGGDLQRWQRVLPMVCGRRRFPRPRVWSFRAFRDTAERCTATAPSRASGPRWTICCAVGVWDDCDVVRKQCLPSGDWPLTLSLTTASKACPAGYTGSIDRYCGDGVWEDPVYNCGGSGALHSP